MHSRGKDFNSMLKRHRSESSLSSYTSNHSFNGRLSPLSPEDKSLMPRRVALPLSQTEKNEQYHKNRENSKKWSLQPIVTPDPEPLNKDNLFCGIENADIIKKYFTVVPYQDFISNLNNTWQEAAKNLKDKQYIAICEVSDDDPKPKSNIWVTGLLLKHNRNFQPDNIYNVDNIDSLYKKTVRECKDIVMADDASYSGLQITLTLSVIPENMKNWNIHIVVPYMSDEAKTSIKESIEEHGLESVKLYSSQTINNIKDIKIHDEDIEHKDFLHKNLSNLILFDHKIADCVSLGVLLTPLEEYDNPVYKIKDNLKKYYDYYREHEVETQKKSENDRNAQYQALATSALAKYQALQENNTNTQNI